LLGQLHQRYQTRVRHEIVIVEHRAAIAAPGMRSLHRELRLDLAGRSRGLCGGFTWLSFCSWLLRQDGGLEKLRHATPSVLAGVAAQLTRPLLPGGVDGGHADGRQCAFPSRTSQEPGPHDSRGGMVCRGRTSEPESLHGEVVSEVARRCRTRQSQPGSVRVHMREERRRGAMVGRQ
ncbi:MAG: hypothetical protein QOE61_4009, partial [Micromonosporaceae bacterium]|nr:hypothetical protein [Micromonosporaceae bacterium]